MGGIFCSCTSDGETFDPYVQDDKGADSCMNSPLLNVPQTDFTVAWSKGSQSSSFQWIFTNAGDRLLKWNLTMIQTDGVVVPWSVAPTSGALSGCELGTVEVSLATWNLTAQAESYPLQLILRSNSYADAARNISIRAFVSADPVPAASLVSLTNATQLVAGSSIQFVVTPIDAAQMTIRDTATLAFVSSLTHPASNATAICRVVYDSTSDLHLGECALPDVVTGLSAGGFAIDVRLGLGFVGGGSHHFQVNSCPDSFVLAHDAHSCTCPAGRYQLGRTCTACADGTAKPSLGIGKADCVQCETYLGETSGDDRTGCNTCASGYYRHDAECFECPEHVLCDPGSMISTWQLEVRFLYMLFLAWHAQ